MTTSAFADLRPPQRQHVLFLLHNCSDNEPRRLPMAVRNFYVVNGYGMLQGLLTGAKLNLHAPAAYIDQHRLKLPPPKLHYDRERNEIVWKGESIDYLIVGSGPAGSVSAHELRRGGKRVVLVERGSFVLPGSMETRMIDGLIDSRASSDGAILIRNGMAVGGGSQVNVDLCFSPMSPSVQANIDSWRREGRIRRSDFYRNEMASAYDWVKGNNLLNKS